MGGFYNIVLIIYLYVVHVIICNPRNSASGCNVVSILIIIIIIRTFKNSLIIQNTKKNHKRVVVLYVIKNHVNLHKL